MGPDAVCSLVPGLVKIAGAAVPVESDGRAVFGVAVSGTPMGEAAGLLESGRFSPAAPAWWWSPRTPADAGAGSCRRAGAGSAVGHRGCCADGDSARPKAGAAML